MWALEPVAQCLQENARGEGDVENVGGGNRARAAKAALSSAPFSGEPVQSARVACSGVGGHGSACRRLFFPASFFRAYSQSAAQHRWRSDASRLEKKTQNEAAWEMPSRKTAQQTQAETPSRQTPKKSGQRGSQNIGPGREHGTQQKRTARPPQSPSATQPRTQ